MCYPSKSVGKNYVIDPIEAHIQLEILRLQKENAALKNWVRDNKDVPRCCVCGKQILNVSIQRLLRTFLWDSQACFRKKPRKVVILETAYGVDIQDVLKTTTKRYKNIQAQCDAIDVSIPYLYVLVKKYCGEDYVKFFAENAIGKRRETYLKKLRNRQQKKYPPRD